MMVDFPEPVAPTMAFFEPGFISKVKSSIIFSLLL